ncbi:SRPBCC domain-containing protein [uncultured Erythrobacter sp.]|uniref:SRPBCC domain-containing protein n=1 Tax=uncultured Erythrobacter sp. TaxID=263913 RepID=UPI00265982CE|nr:SRPBCC domain-containing protein [uncultured Erythrobacter sp.]
MTATAQNGWAMSVTRHIAAPPHHVWHIMTARQAEWYCPLPWLAEVIFKDWRAGGRDAMLFRGPNGEEMPQEGLFLEVVPGVRWVSTDAFVRAADGNFMPTSPFMVGCWEIKAEGEGTLYTATARHWDEDAAKRHIDMGFEDGWGACADQLKTLCEAASGER